MVHPRATIIHKDKGGSIVSSGNHIDLDGAAPPPSLAAVRPSLLSAASGKGSSTSTATAAAIAQGAAASTSTSASSSPSASPSRRAAPSYSRSHSRSTLSLPAVSAVDVEVEVEVEQVQEEEEERGRAATPPGSVQFIGGSDDNDDDDDNDNDTGNSSPPRTYAAAARRSESPRPHAHTPQPDPVGDLLKDDDVDEAESEGMSEGMNSFDDSGQVVAKPASLHAAAADPRVMLREQLKRSESVRGGLHHGTSATHNQSSHPASGKLEAREGSLRTRSPSSLRSRSASAIAHAATAESHPSPSVETALRPRRYIVLTSAGKPVYASPASSSAASHPAATRAESESERDSEEALTSLVGVIQAIVSLYAMEEEGCDRIRYIDAGQLRIAFLLKAPLYLVAISDWGEPEAVLRTHLDYLYLQILSVVSHAQLHAIFAKRANFDLRRLLEGTDGIMDALVERLQWDFECTHGALRVLPLDITLRDECAHALRPPTVEMKRNPDILYALLLSHTTLITLLRPKSHSIHPSDLHILLNTLAASSSLRTPNSESWLPICLPKFNAKGFVYACISYFEPAAEEENGVPHGRGDFNLGLGTVLITTDREGFFDMKAWKDAIAEKLHAHTPTPAGLPSSLYARLAASLPVSSASASGFSAAHALPLTHHPHSLLGATASAATAMPPIPALRHYVYKSRTYVQITHPPFAGEYEYTGSLSARRRLVGLYQRVRASLHECGAGPGAGAGGTGTGPAVGLGRSSGPMRLVYAVTADEAVLGMVTTSYELYLAFPPLVPKKTATDSAHALARWVKKNESTLFLTSAPHF